jgi:hypothetical protein
MAGAGVSVAAGWDIGEDRRMKGISRKICHRGTENTELKQLPMGECCLIVNDVARVAQLDRALASEAEG